MKKTIEELYQKAKRFDESGVYQSEEYAVIAKQQNRLYKEISALFGPVAISLLEEYTAAIGDEMELECKHFFEQGYLLGLSDTPR